MSVFKQSTQFKHWIFKNPDLDLMQVQKFERGLKILADLNRDINQQLHATGVSNVPSYSSGDAYSNKSQTKVMIIQPLEEKLYIAFYTNQMKDIINRKTPSRTLKTYALSFFRRFYLRKTAIDYDPDYILCASLFLGFKVAQISVNLDLMKSICPFLKDKHTEKNIENILLLLEYEFFLINILNYDFYVYCPYKAMLGFMYELANNEKKLKSSGEHIIFDDNFFKEFENKCEAFIDQTFLTDLLFSIPYSYIALSCIFITAEFYKIDYDLIKKYLNLENYINYEQFYTETLFSVRDTLSSLKILNEEEFVGLKKRILKFLNKNPKYVQKIENDREGVKIKMKQFSDMFDDNLVNNQVPHDKFHKSIKKDHAENFEKPDDKILIENKRERTVSENK